MATRMEIFKNPTIATKMDGWVAAYLPTLRLTVGKGSVEVSYLNGSEWGTSSSQYLNRLRKASIPGKFGVI